MNRTVLPWTWEDCAIWGQISLRLSADIGIESADLLNENYVLGDRIDAEIMHARTHRHTFFCRICCTHAAKEACTFGHSVTTWNGIRQS
jgi:hypothetical protein